MIYFDRLVVSENIFIIIPFSRVDHTWCKILFPPAKLSRRSVNETRCLKRCLKNCLHEVPTASEKSALDYFDFETSQISSKNSPLLGDTGLFSERNAKGVSMLRMVVKIPTLADVIDKNVLSIGPSPYQF